MIPLGILASAGAAPGPAFELIQTVNLNFTTQDVTFSNLQTHASSYRHLQVRAVIRNAGGSESLRIRLNGQTSGYSYHWLGRVPNPTSLQSVGFPDSQSVDLGSIPTTPASMFAPLILDLNDAYSTSKNKTLRWTWGYSDGTIDGSRIQFGSGVLMSTAQLSSMSFLSGSSASFQPGVRFSLYGIRG